MKHAGYLGQGRRPTGGAKGLYGNNDFMTWSFYGGYTDPNKKAASDIAPFVQVDRLHPQDGDGRCGRLPEHDRQAEGDTRRYLFVGRDRMLNKKVGEKFSPADLNYPGIDLPSSRSSTNYARTARSPRRHHADGYFPGSVRQVRERDNGITASGNGRGGSPVEPDLAARAEPEPHVQPGGQRHREQIRTSISVPSASTPRPSVFASFLEAYRKTADDHEEDHLRGADHPSSSCRWWWPWRSASASTTNGRRRSP